MKVSICVSFLHQYSNVFLNFFFIYLFICLYQVLVATLQISVAHCGIFFFLFVFRRSTWDLLVPWPDIEPRPSALGAPSPSHQTTREAQIFFFLYLYMRLFFQVSFVTITGDMINLNQYHNSAFPQSTLHGTHSGTADGPLPKFFLLTSQMTLALSSKDGPSPSSLKEARVGTTKETLLLMQETHSFIWNMKYQNTAGWTGRSWQMGLTGDIILWILTQGSSNRIHRTWYPLVWRRQTSEEPLWPSYNALGARNSRRKLGQLDSLMAI